MLSARRGETGETITKLTGDDRSVVHGSGRLAFLASHGRSPIAVHRFWGLAVRLASSLLPIGPTVITSRPSLAGAHRNPSPRFRSPIRVSPNPPRARTHGHYTGNSSLARTQKQSGRRAEHRLLIVYHALSSSIEVGSPLIWSVPYSRADIHFPHLKRKRRIRSCVVGRKRRNGAVRKSATANDRRPTCDVCRFVSIHRKTDFSIYRIVAMLVILQYFAFSFSLILPVSPTSNYASTSF